MSYIGRKIRENRILFEGTDVGLIVPIDHGLTVGPLRGISSLSEINKWISNKNISAIIAHKGTVELLASNNILPSNTGLIIQLNGMLILSDDPDTKQMVTNVEAALKLGADAVSIQLNFLNTNFSHNIETIGRVVDDAHKYGLPVLAMLYDKVSVPENSEKIERMQKITRAAAELGVDFVKISFPENILQLNDLISHLKGMVKVFFAGGEVMNEMQLMTMTATAMRVGIAGLCAGRNVFQHPDPKGFINKLGKIILTKGSNGFSTKDKYVDFITHSAKEDVSLEIK